MDAFLDLFVEYPIQLLLIFGGTVLAIEVLVNWKKKLSHKSKWFVISLLLGYLLVIFNGFLLIIKP